MRKNLPYLNQSRLNSIFNEVYGHEDNITTPFEDERIQDLADTLYSMQRFNYHYRPDDTRDLFRILDHIFRFEYNSEGTALWLALILAIKELYGFDDKRLVQVMQMVEVRK